MDTSGPTSMLRSLGLSDARGVVRPAVCCFVLGRPCLMVEAETFLLMALAAPGAPDDMRPAPLMVRAMSDVTSLLVGLLLEPLTPLDCSLLHPSGITSKCLDLILGHPSVRAELVFDLRVGSCGTGTHFFRPLLPLPMGGLPWRLNAALRTPACDLRLEVLR